MRFTKTKAWVFLILVLAVILRLYHISDISLWHDEAFSALLIKYSWHEMFYRISLDVHPPLYYVVLRLWSYVFGNSVLALRGMSAFFGVATVGMGYLFVRQAFKSQKTAIIAAFLLAVSPFQTKFEFALEARMYTLGTFLALAAAYCLVRALEKQRQAHELKNINIPNLPEAAALRKEVVLFYLLFSLATAGMLYTHYFLYFTAAALALYGFLYLFFHHKWDIKKYFQLLGSLALAGMLWLPWVKTLLMQVKQVENGYWIPPMDMWSIPSTLWEMLLSFRFDNSKILTQAGISLVTVFVLFIVVRFVRRTDNFAKWLVLAGIAAPFLGSVAFLVLSRLKGSETSVYFIRYFLYSGIFFTLMLAVWLDTLRPFALARVALVIYAILNLSAYVLYWQAVDVSTRPGMDAAAKYLHANVEPGHKVYVGVSSEFFNYKYYAETKYPIPTRPLLYRGGARHVSEVPHYAGSALLTDEDLVPDFKEATRSGDTVWLIWTNAFYSGKPNVPGNWVSINELEWPEVRPVLGTNIYVTEYKVN